MEALNKGYIYQTSILSRYLYEEISRALQQHLVIRNVTLPDILDDIKTSASKLLGEESFR